MKAKRYKISEELRGIAKNLGKSPTKKEITKDLECLCIQYFGSFNEAKVKASLEIYNKKKISRSEVLFTLDIELVSLISFLTCDGHLFKDLSGFYLCSNDKEILEKFEHLIKRKFDIGGDYKYGLGYYGKSCINYRVFNRIVCRFLYKAGTPSGAKVLTKFDVPQWIKENKEFAREYLKIAFYCEGSKWKASKNSQSINFRMHKAENLLSDGLKFMESLKSMLNIFKIRSGKTTVSRGNIRKNGITTKSLAFTICNSDVNRFINEIGWMK